jgi:hypothetical protein
MVTVKGLFSDKNKDGTKYYHLDKIDLTELNIKNAKMSVAKAFNNNRILRKCPFVDRSDMRSDF